MPVPNSLGDDFDWFGHGARIYNNGAVYIVKELEPTSDDECTVTLDKDWRGGKSGYSRIMSVVDVIVPFRYEQSKGNLKQLFVTVVLSNPAW